MTPAEHARTQQPRLKAFLDNELSAWRQFAMRLHLARCAACREEMRAMQQIGEELRGQALDPLDPRLRSRILATVREMTPEAAPSLRPQTRRLPLVWGGAAAALLLIAFIAPNFWKYGSPLRQNAATGSEPAPGNERVAVSSGGAELSRPLSASAEAPAAQEAQKQPERPAQITKAPVERPAYDAASSISPAQSAPDALSVQKSAAMADSESKMDKVQGRVLSASGQTARRQRLPYGGDSAAGKRVQDFSGAAPNLLQTPLNEGALQKHRSAAQPVVLQKAGFDLKGYQLVTRRGRRIIVPFKESLNALRFARATDGRMTFAEASPSPVLTLRPTDALQNDAVPGCYWQPLITGSFSARPLYARPAPDWAQFVAMRWYPNMIVVGGLTSLEAEDASFVWLLGSYVRIGATRLPDFVAYRAYAAAHPDAFRLHAVYDSALTPATAAPPPAASKTSGRLLGHPRP